MVAWTDCARAERNKVKRWLTSRPCRCWRPQALRSASSSAAGRPAAGMADGDGGRRWPTRSVRRVEWPMPMLLDRIAVGLVGDMAKWQTKQRERIGCRPGRLDVTNFEVCRRRARGRPGRDGADDRTPGMPTGDDPGTAPSGGRMTESRMPGMPLAEGAGAGPLTERMAGPRVLDARGGGSSRRRVVIGRMAGCRIPGMARYPIVSASRHEGADDRAARPWDAAGR